MLVGCMVMNNPSNCAVLGELSIALIISTQAGQIPRKRMDNLS